MAWETYEEVAARLVEHPRLRPDERAAVRAIRVKMDACGGMPSGRDRDYLCELDEKCKRPLVCKHLRETACAYKERLEYYRQVGQTDCGFVIAGRFDECEFFVEEATDGTDT